MRQKLVVIGAGMASGRMLEHLFEDSPESYDVTLFGAEPRGNYNRIMLSPVLAGEKRYEDIITHDAAWYAANGVDCRFRRDGHRHRPQAQGSGLEERRDGIRQAGDRHRFGAVHHPDRGQGPAAA